LSTTTRVYPKILYRWVGDLLADGAAHSPASLTNLAVEKQVLRSAHARTFRIAVTWLMTKAKIAPQTTISPHNVPIDAWWASTWQAVLHGAAPASGPLKYRFLIARATDGQHHHASSLAWLMTQDDLQQHDINAPNLATARFNARRSFAQLRRTHIAVPATGIRGIESNKRQVTVQYLAFDAVIWKSAAEIPGYYGLHTPDDEARPNPASH